MHVQPNHRRRETSVRTQLTLIILALCAPALAMAMEGEDSCPIPKLEPGVPANVRLKHIGKRYCGIALVNGKYQKLSEISMRTEESPIACDSDLACHKTIKYYLDERSAPYIIQFNGPKKTQADDALREKA